MNGDTGRGTPGSEGVYAHVLAEVVGREAVRRAEEVVSAAWIGQLLQTEHEAASALRDCEEARWRLAEIVRAARAAGDAGQIAAKSAQLEAVDDVLATRRAACEQARELLEHELAEWACATQARVTTALLDQDWLAAVMRAAGIDGAGGG